MPTMIPQPRANAAVPSNIQGFSLQPNGQMMWNHTVFPNEVGFYDFDLSGGARLFKASGAAQDLVFVFGAKKKATRFVAGQGWVDTSHHLPGKWQRVAVRKCRLRRALGNFLGALGERVLWLPQSEVTNPYAGGVELGDDGRVGVAGAVYGAGQMFSPVTLTNGWLVLRPNPDEVMIRDEDGVRERFRFEQCWKRLVALKSLPQNTSCAGVGLGSDGSVLFSGADGPDVCVEQGQSFVMYRSARQCVLRGAHEERVVLRDNGQVQEVVFHRGRWWSVAGARDNWSWSPAGCPGPNDRWSLPAMPGITLHANGNVEVLGASYLEGQPINLVSGGTRIQREAGRFQPLYVASDQTIVGFVKQSDGEWWKGLATAPDPSRHGVWGVFTSRSMISIFSDFMDARVAEAPGLSLLLVVLLFLNRQMDGIRAHAGIFLGYEAMLLLALTGVSMALYVLLVGLTLTYGVAYGVVRHLVRSWVEC